MPTECVKVVVRCRPLNSKEKTDGREKIVDMDTRRGSITVKVPKGEAAEPPKQFTFDQVYDENTRQIDLFDITARPIVDSVLGGYNGTIFAYGQTGTGKSFTMEGKEEPPELRGITPNTCHYIFERIAQEGGTKEYLVRVSYLEIYNEDIRDLLSKSPEMKLELKESPDRGVYVKDLMQFVVKSPQEMESVLQVGRKNRMTGATLMNQDSSRSHSIFTITIECTEKLEGLTGADDEGHIRVGKLNLVDLAGSERQSKTGATGDRLKEGIKINLSLTALGNVISSLVDGTSTHIPYRDSKLTRLLQDSLGGNTKTCMVANIGPADWNYDETMSTLRYANRAKNIKNQPKINEDPKDAMLREFQDEIQRLKAELAARGGVMPGEGGVMVIKKAKEKVIVDKVVEKTVVVENTAELERIQEAMKKELEEKMTQDMTQEALAKARAEVEKVAKAKIEKLLADANKTEEEKRVLREALEQQHAQAAAAQALLEKEKAEREELAARIKAMEGKVIHAGVNLLDKVDELKKRSEDTKREMALRQRQEEEQRRRLEDLEANNMEFDKKYSSLEEEIAAKTKKLKKLFEKYQGKKAEISDLQEQFQREREDLLEDYRALTQQIKLKNLVIASFIPPEYQDKIMQHCHWQDYDESWAIDYLPYSGNAIRSRQEMAEARAKDQAMNSNAKPGMSAGQKAAMTAIAANGAAGTPPAETDKLANVYFTYDNEEIGAVADGRPKSSKPASAGRPLTNTGRKSAKKAIIGGADPTNIGSLKDSVATRFTIPTSKEKQQAAFPTARGLVQDPATRRRSKA